MANDFEFLDPEPPKTITVTEHAGGGGDGVEYRDVERPNPEHQVWLDRREQARQAQATRDAEAGAAAIKKAEEAAAAATAAAAAPAPAPQIVVAGEPGFDLGGFLASLSPQGAPAPKAAESGSMLPLLLLGAAALWAFRP